MEDPVVGGYDTKRRALRKAICLAIDLDEVNETFYNGTAIVYDGPIPPQLEGYPEDGNAPVSNRGPDLKRAKELLTEAGYPDGKGLPVIDYYVSRGGNEAEQSQMLVRQLERIGVRVNPKLVDFSDLIDAVNRKKATFFGYAWGTDYPDAENNLQLFYGPNVAPGSNSFNYRNPDFDRLYEQVRVMPPGAERTKIYEQMRDMVIEDAAFSGSMARTRYYLINPWLRNFKPSEDFYNWMKYLDVDESKRN
jgi:ABC-type transport system substrate-binding protein